MSHCFPKWDVTGGDLDLVTHSTDLSLPHIRKCEPTQQRKFNLSSMASVPDHDFEELCWENDQLLVVMQSQNGKVQKQRHWPVSASSNFSTIKESEGAVPTSCLVASEKDGTLEAMVHDVVKVADTSGCNNYMQEDELVSWIQYPLDEPLEKYCTELLTDIRSPNSARTWKDREAREPVHGERDHTSSVGSARCTSRERSSKSACDSLLKLAPTDLAAELSLGNESSPTSLTNSLSCGNIVSPAQPEAPFKKEAGMLLPSITKALSSTSSVTASKVTVGSESAMTSCQMPPPKMQAGTSSRHSRLQFGNSGSMNFSHFSKPAATLKASLHAIELANGSNVAKHLNQLNRIPVEACMSTESSIESSTTNMSLPMSGSPVSDPPNGLQSLGTMLMPLQILSSGKEEDSVSLVNDHVCCSSKAEEPHNGWNSCLTTNMTSGTESGTIVGALEPTITCSSGGSGSNALKNGKGAGSLEKRKTRDVEDPECQSDDPEDESGDKKKPPSARSASVKRSRAAEIHNLSERRRRDRINEKMKALQELIPNSNKTDKASLLEEVIEYLKMLQTQLQVMSFRSGMSMSSVLMPPEMQCLQMAQLTSLPYMGMGMGMGLGMMDMTASSSVRHALPLPAFSGSLFPCSAIPTIPGSAIPTIPGTVASGSAVSVPASAHLGTSVSAPSERTLFPVTVCDRFDSQPSDVVDHKTYISHQQLQVPTQPLNMNMYSTYMMHQHLQQPLANYNTTNPSPQ